MKYKYYQVDAFTNQPFEGNPAGVIFANIEDEQLMQKIAFENNLSETAFISKTNNEYYIRWFAPLCEVNLCGHATLASAYVFFNFIDKDATEFCLNSKSGVLKVTKKNNKYFLDFPKDELKPYGDYDLVEKVVGKRPIDLYHGRDDILAIYDIEADIHEIIPNFNLLADISSRGLIVSAQSKEYDFISRCFFPGAGVNEDPVTGSAHTTLIPYWSKVLNKTKMLAKQVSQRGGILHCDISGDRVIIGGEAVLFLIGEIDLG
jgi:PhzF family phenazine biosynthesis protein